jgi:phage shock protein C
MFCTNCGKSIDPTARFCPACGTAAAPTATAYTYVPPPQPAIPLFRPRHPRAIGGVCSAFALHFGWDVSLVRIFTVIATLSCGIPLFVYLAAWIIIPEEPLYTVPYTPPASESSSNLA